MTEIDALERLQVPARDLRAQFERAIESARRPLWRFCVALTGSVWDGEDLAQEAVVRALGKLHQFGQASIPVRICFALQPTPGSTSAGGRARSRIWMVWPTGWRHLGCRP